MKVLYQNEDGYILREHRHTDGKSTMVLHQYQRVVAKVRWMRAIQHYYIKGNGVCLLDKKPHPTTPNKGGIVNPQIYMIEGGIREARQAMLALIPVVSNLKHIISRSTTHDTA